MHLAVLSNVNMEPLRALLPPGQHYFGGYGRYLEELFDPNSPVHSGPFDTLLLHLEGEEMIKEISGTLTTLEDARKIMIGKLDDVLRGMDAYVSQQKDKQIIITTIVCSPLQSINYLDGNSEYSMSSLEKELNAHVMRFAAQHSQVHILDWQRVVLWLGYQEVVDDKFWYLGRIKYTRQAFQAMAREIYNIRNAIDGRSKKVLVLDLDNTLWGGVIGEDGIGGIGLSEDGIGKAYRDFQSTIKSLTQLGVLLAVNSKNNLSDVEEVFAKHPMMVLKKEDFAVIKVNWNSKVDNMREIAQELNLKMDSFVFLDDDPRELGQIYEYLAGEDIFAPYLPKDPAHLKTWFLREVVYPYFPKLFVTGEDTAKIKQYKSQVQRREIAKVMDMDSFVESLHIQTEFYINDQRFVQRTAQLTQKTNQFNFTTRRYSEADIEHFMKAGNAFVFNVDYKDRFGHEGIIGAAIAKINGEKAHLDVFLLSCRVIGKKVEHTFLEKIVAYCHSHGVKHIGMEFIPTSKNTIAAAFYYQAQAIVESLTWSATSKEKI